jgi:hypothetical protein
MASDVDICNLALSHIGQDANITSISPPDGSFEADKAAMFYPIARDELLEKHAYRFALRRETLAAFASNPSTQWSYAYAIPNKCLRPLAVLLVGATDDSAPQPYDIETAADGQQILLTNAPAGATLKFIMQQTDTTKFTPLFVVALSWRTAAYLAGPITKDLKQKDGCLKISEAYALDAGASDANSRYSNVQTESRVPAHMKARE